MTAVTLSTIGCRSSDFGQAAVEVVGRGSFVGGRELPVVVETIVNVPGGAARAGARGRDAAETAGRNREALEHKARGLLNLVAMVSRCLRDETASPAMREQWQEEIRQAGERLEALYRGGLSRTFLSKPAPAATVGP